MAYHIDPDWLQKYVRNMTPLLGVEILYADDEPSVAEKSVIIVTTTPSREPYLKTKWLYPDIPIPCGRGPPWKTRTRDQS
jgi:ornithine cyclodeaminase/alanine dehydrogenase-like protein (mu-crystallin family)